MKRKTLILSALVSLGLLVTLLIKLIWVPGGMILPGWFLGGMVIILILLAALVLAWLVKLIVKKPSFWTAYFILTAIGLHGISLPTLFTDFKNYSPRELHGGSKFD